MIKKVMIVSAFAAVTTSASTIAADDTAGGVINFSGAITDTTCTINGGKSADFTVALSPITITEAGNTVGLINKNKKSFSMTFS
ncbi:TPA: fimbrial protein, partial [Citrobacter freundii]